MAHTYNNKSGAHVMRKVASITFVSVLAGCWFASAVHASAVEVEEAVALMRQMHADQCQQQQLRGKVMLAHRNHDQDTLDELWPQIEAISKRLKPLEDRLKVLKGSIKQNYEEQNAFETAQLREAECG